MDARILSKTTDRQSGMTKIQPDIAVSVWVFGAGVGERGGLQTGRLGMPVMDIAEMSNGARREEGRAETDRGVRPRRPTVVADRHRSGEGGQGEGGSAVFFLRQKRDQEEPAPAPAALRLAADAPCGDAA